MVAMGMILAIVYQYRHTRLGYGWYFRATQGQYN